MYLFDVATDWNLFRTMQGSYSEFNDDFNPIFLGNQSDLMCTCSCTSGDPCVTPLSNTTLCDTFALNEGGSSCNIRHVVTLDSRSGGQCDYTFGYDKTSSLIDELSSLRWASLAINIIITPLVLYYLVWQARQGLDHDEATISRVMSRKSSRTSNFDAHQLETIQQEQLQHKRQSQTNFSGSVSSDHLPTAPNAKHPCFNCNFELHPKARFCPNCGAKQMEFNKDTMQGKQIRRWLKRFLGMMHLRMVFLLFEDLPQIIILIRYIVILDSNEGLTCRYCAANGAACRFADVTKRTTLIISLLGTFASLFVFLFQMTLAEIRTYRTYNCWLG
ncbi:hypothetical protein PTSG_02493 [Salpingoeca rosetta]|uniref:Uncharacterized protein n=1 Tax=Salpingoeca rosetta (strain ATCC 50818 / BSB-021) TaxID=946362 RepID=F2U2C8_SALR5|nr:uncharacterized protein PTSG_02493 [Salpingoeca rosetta]EGD81780.1 hypothetical protein PTSG_02493 [Salpingoeca rosetta]|eukprot:XP_004996984.1 hypothetical protein PTSG_02493 [Salpingoeca rosetta]